MSAGQLPVAGANKRTRTNSSTTRIPSRLASERRATWCRQPTPTCKKAHKRRAATCRRGQVAARHHPFETLTSNHLANFRLLPVAGAERTHQRHDIQAVLVNKTSQYNKCRTAFS